jgi:deoxyribonuclease-4
LEKADGRWKLKNAERLTGRFFAFPTAEDLQRVQKAWADAEKALPLNAFVFEEEGIFRQKTGDRPGAISDFKKAVELGANTFQIFSASPRMWRAAPLKPDQVRRLRVLREKHDLWPLVVHDNYLINLAAREPLTRARSIQAFRGELERALAIGADYLVAHPGSYQGQTLGQGIEAVAEGLREAAKGLKSSRLTILLENTAGAGALIGSRFEELAQLRALARRGLGFRVGYCLDTAHALASGYDVAGAA